jgi:SAM-dependent methyltransferase
MTRSGNPAMTENSLVLVPCPLCGAQDGFLPLRITDTDLHIGKHGDLYGGRTISDWKACGRCGFVHQNPRPSLEALRSFYATGQYHPPELPVDKGRHLDFARWYYTEKVEYALAAAGARTGRVFEVGCGLGGALWLFKERGWTPLGVEPDPAQAGFCAQTMELAGVRQGLVDASLSLDEKVDLVFSNHAFEHLADLNSVMKGITRVLKPGGHIFTAVPTYYRNRSRVSKEWMNSAHYSLFTHRSLNQLMAYHGFEEVRHTYRGWRKEIDDVWHVARYTGTASKPEAQYEDPRAVQRYINFYNPIRSAAYAPVYAGYAKRIQLLRTVGNMGALFRRSPGEFIRKAARRCLRAFQGPAR